jgi:hypothetical protein
MFEENEILTQIKALGDDLRSRLDDMDRRLRKIEEEVSTPPAPAQLASHAHLTAADNTPTPAEHDPTSPVRSVAVTISPLHDVSKVRVVEAAFDAIDGVESTSLQTLSGDAAHLEVKAHEDVALISGLRRTLQLAFDVSESEGSSFTVALAQPGAERGGGVAARRAS